MITGSKYPRKPHPPGSSFAMDFSDKTAEDRSAEKMDLFVNEMRVIANKYGFNIQTWGPTKNVVRAVAPAYMEKVMVMRDE